MNGRQIKLDDGAVTTLEQFGDRGPIVLCIHGMTSYRGSWERLARHYSDRFRFYAYDQRGHGSCAQFARPMTLHRSLLDLYNVLEAIGEPVDTLLGHSWGGAIAILGGRRFDVSRVVAIDPMLRQGNSDWYDTFLSDLKQFLRYKGDKRDAKVRAAYKDWTDVDREHKVEALRVLDRKTIERLRDENSPETWDLRRDLEQYPKPLFLALAGQEHSLVALEDLKLLRARGGSNLTMRVFSEGDHSLHRTAFEEFVRELDTFFERTAQTGAALTEAG